MNPDLADLLERCIKKCNDYKGDPSCADALHEMRAYIEQLEVVLHSVRIRGYRPEIESGEPYEPCWCFHMPADFGDWWKPGVWEHDHRCSAAREVFREKEIRAAKRAQQILKEHTK